MELNKVSYELNGQFSDFYVVARSRDEAYAAAIKTLRKQGLYDLITALIISDSYIKPPFVFDGWVEGVEE